MWKNRKVFGQNQEACVSGIRVRWWRQSVIRKENKVPLEETETRGSLLWTIYLCPCATMSMMAMWLWNNRRHGTCHGRPVRNNKDKFEKRTFALISMRRDIKHRIHCAVRVALLLRKEDYTWAYAMLCVGCVATLLLLWNLNFHDSVIGIECRQIVNSYILFWFVFSPTLSPSPFVLGDEWKWFRADREHKN